ncbi:phosphoribosylglycinamide formyltransferase [Pseudomonadota bacterium]
MTDRMFSLAVLISGNGSNLQAIIDQCEAGQINARICCVVSNEESAFGLERAKDAGIPTHVLSHRGYPSRDQYDTDLAALLETCRPDLIVLAGFMRILGAGFIDRFPNRIINLHPSLLPNHKGLDTHARALEAGDREHGASVHLVTPDLDSGPVLIQAAIRVAEDDTVETLQNKVHELEHDILPRVVGWFADHRITISGDLILLDNVPIGKTDTE